MKKLQVLLVEDHIVVRDGIRLLLLRQPDIDVVGEAADGQEACYKALELLPDLVIMDLALPELSGIDATRWISERLPSVKILVLTAHEDLNYMHEVMNSGAAGYVLKRAAAEELIDAIHMVIQGQTYIDPYLSSSMARQWSYRELVRPAAWQSLLSPREGKVLRLIAEGYSNKEIAALLELSVKTVETYKTRAMQKLGLNSRAGIVRFALKNQWLQNGNGMGN